MSLDAPALDYLDQHRPLGIESLRKTTAALRHGRPLYMARLGYWTYAVIDVSGPLYFKIGKHYAADPESGAIGFVEPDKGIIAEVSHETRNA